MGRQDDRHGCSHGLEDAQGRRRSPPCRHWGAFPHWPLCGGQADRDPGWHWPHDSVGALVDPNVPAYLMSTVKEADAKAAYAALVDFAGVVKAHPITASTPASTVSGGS